MSGQRVVRGRLVAGEEEKKPYLIKLNTLKLAAKLRAFLKKKRPSRQVRLRHNTFTVRPRVQVPPGLEKLAQW